MQHAVTTHWVWAKCCGVRVARPDRGLLALQRAQAPPPLASIQTCTGNARAWLLLIRSNARSRTREWREASCLRRFLELLLNAYRVTWSAST